MRTFFYVLALYLAWAFQSAHADTQVNVVGLFTGKAVLVINNGKPQTLSVGQVSAEGVKLISANSQSAVLEIEGKRRELMMGQGVAVGGSTKSQPASVTLYANSAGHHLAEGQINGVPLKFIVDTGATSIAMNSADARKAGIDYKKGEQVPVHTASGNVAAYRVVINTLKIGAVVLHQVEGVVLEGNSPAVVLLGMSALSRLEMKREGIALTLIKKY
ncbi:MAG: TIGR02281 family clan AA aspartic protease [Betaproteobacteria bacterium HGW-Betaproteobacteria-1]|jgi:aspartyl protease family protein|nr:MAG: TIGR02281 family clan AA aspartic protease [Betaproteobacteria bacterium HGW-Betaproteobacteria-1]